MDTQMSTSLPTKNQLLAVISQYGDRHYLGDRIGWQSKLDLVDKIYELFDTAANPPVDHHPV